MPLAGYYHNELERVDKASKRLREVMDGLSPAFYIGMLTVDGVLTYVNRTALDAIGAELKDVLGKRFEDTEWWSFSQRYRQQLREAIVKAANGKSSRFDVIFQDVSGRLVTLDFSLNPIFDVKKNVSYLVPSGHDVTERRAAERALTMLRVCNKSLLHAQDEATLLHDTCQLIVDVGGYRMSWVGFAENDDAKTIKPIAHAGNNQGYLSKVTISWDENELFGQGPAGQCIRNSEVVVCKDTRIDVSTVSWRKYMTEHGYLGVVVLPLRNEQQTFGLLGLYSAHVLHITDDEISLLQELADNLAFGIINLRAQQEQRQVLSAVRAIAEGVSASTGTAFFEKLALNMTKALGAQVGAVTRLQVGEPLYSRTVAAVVDGEVVENFDILIQGTPCENLNSAEEWIVKKDVVQHYPCAPALKTLNAQAYIGRRIDNSLGQPMGQIFVLFRQPLVQVEFASSVLKIFTARVAAELERQN